jgi:hypothetical protein
MLWSDNRIPLFGIMLEPFVLIGSKAYTLKADWNSLHRWCKRHASHASPAIAPDMGSVPLPV